MSAKKRPGRPPKYVRAKAIGVYLPSELIKRVDEKARQLRMSRSELITKILEFMLKKQNHMR